jgi:hypothetical protein
MRSVRKIGLALFFAVASLNQSAEARDLTPAQTRAYGFNLFGSGDLAGALAVAQALLQRDPTDAAALFLQAQAQGVGPAARRSGRMAYRSAKDNDTRFSAAMLLASSYAQDNRKMASQYWLRKASDVAPNDQARDVAREEFDYLRSRSPYVLLFGFSVHPSSNVNDGSSEPSFHNPGIPWLPPEIDIAGEQAALSGGEADADVSLTYRLPPTATTRSEFSLTARQHSVWLSKAAKFVAPEAVAGNYASANIEAGFQRMYRQEKATAIYRFGVYISHSWAGGEDQANAARLEFGAEKSLQPNLQGFANFTAEREWRLDSAIRSTNVYALNLGLSHKLSNGDGIMLALGQRVTDSDSIGLKNNAASLRLGWQKAKPIAGIDISAQAVAEWRDYPLSPYDLLHGRQDKRLALTLTVGLPEISYMGFSPSINLVAAKTQSNIALFTAEEFGINLGFKSNF